MNMLIFFGSMVFVGLILIVKGLSKLSRRSQECSGEDYGDYNGQHDEQARLFNEEVIRQQNQHFMEESLKSVTPFEMGGYDMTQGNSFNDCNNGMF